MKPDQIKDGDIFRWSYREPVDYNRYHCCSRIAVATRGRLLDTFWSGSYDGARSFGPDDFPRLDLTYLGNFADLEKTPEWEADYYADADIVNLNHSNSTRDNFYIRKGAKRSAAKMLEVARRKLEESESKKRMAESAIERLHETIAKIETGEIEGVYL